MKRKSHIDSKKNDILNAAMRLFAVKGIEGTSVKEIGVEAGVTDAAIYKHFASKNAVALEVFSEYCNGYTKRIDYYVHQAGSFRSRYERLIDDLLDTHDEDHCGLLLLSQHNELMREEAGSDIRQPRDALEELIQQGIDAGELPEQDTRLSAIFAIGIFMRLAVSSYQGELPSELKPMAAEIKLRLLAMLGIANA